MAEISCLSRQPKRTYRLSSACGKGSGAPHTEASTPDSMIDEFDWDRHREMELLRVHHPAYSVYLIRKDRQNIGYLTINKADVITLQSLYIVSEYQRQGDRTASLRFHECILPGAPCHRLHLPLCSGKFQCPKLL